MKDLIDNSKQEGAAIDVKTSGKRKGTLTVSFKKTQKNWKP